MNGIRLFLNLLLVFVWVISIYVSESLIQLVFFWFFLSYTLIKYRGRFSHPLGLFSLLYGLYATSYLGHTIINGSLSDEVHQSVFLHALGFSAYYMVCTTYELFSNKLKKYSARDFNRDFVVKPMQNSGSLKTKVILAMALLFSFNFLYGAITSGAGSKRELVDSIGILTQVSYYFVILFSIWYFIYFVDYYSNQSTLAKSIYFVMLYFLIIYVVTGERDIVFRLALFISLFYFDFIKKFKFKYYILILLAIFIILPITQFYKAVYLSSELSAYELDSSKIFVGEFISSGRNVSKLLQSDSHAGFFYGEVIISDFLRFLNVSLDGNTVQSTAYWFNEEFLPSQGINPNSGWGFSWIGFWYLAGNWFGIIIGMSLTAYLLMQLYIYRSNSSKNYVLYLVLLATLIYVQRGDLANFLGNFIKFGLLPVLIFYYLQRFVIRSYHANDFENKKISKS